MNHDRREELLALAGELRPDLHRSCGRLMGSVIDGEDVVQDTLVRAFVALEDLEEAPFSEALNPTRSRPMMPALASLSLSLWWFRSMRAVSSFPSIDVPSGETAHFHTIGIYEMFSGPDSIPHGPSTWRCIEMSGTAQNVIVPLD
jgi:Sigma-70 region 2